VASVVAHAQDNRPVDVAFLKAHVHAIFWREMDMLGLLERLKRLAERRLVLAFADSCPIRGQEAAL
jgi:hypothetical protein